MAASSCARRITDSRKPCGVCSRTRLSRRGMSVMAPSATTAIVSEEGTATATARCAGRGERGGAGGDARLSPRGPRGVVKEHVALVVAHFLEAPRGGLPPGGPAGNDPGQLAVAAGRQRLPRLGGVTGGHHHQDRV